MGDESVGSARNDALNVREERLRRKLHRELGAVVLEALGDEKTIEVMVNPDGRVWWDRLGDGQSLLPDEFSAERAESLVGTVAALLERKFVPRGPTVAVLSGGNIEWDGLCGLLGK